MATLYGAQYQDAFVTKPSVKIKPGDVSGDIQHMYFSYDAPATPPLLADIIKLGKLPKGARVVEMLMSTPDLGATGTVNVGWAASAELDGPTGLTGSPVEAADADGFGAAVDVNTAAATYKISDTTVPGLLKEFAAAVDVQLAVTAAWDATSGTIKGYIAYVIV